MATRVFTVRPALEVGSLIAEYDNGGSYRRNHPVIAGPRTDWVKRTLLPHMFGEVQPPEAQVVRFTNATVRGPGVIILPGDVIVAESLINSAGFEPVAGLVMEGAARFVATSELPAARPAASGRHVLIKQRYDENYGHWIIETLPRIALLDEVVGREDLRVIISGAAGTPMGQVMVDSLGWFGIQPDQISRIGEASSFEELIYPLPLTVHAWTKAPVVIDILEEMAGRVRTGCSGPERIFLTRPSTSRRLLLIQDEIAGRLAEHGYIAIDAGELSFADQVRMMAGARCVIGTLGAECANLVFAPRGVRFLGLAPAEMQDDFFYDLVSQKDGAYFCLHGPSEGGHNAPFTVDLAALDDLRDEMESC